MVLLSPLLWITNRMMHPKRPAWKLRVEKWFGAEELILWRSHCRTVGFTESMEILHYREPLAIVPNGLLSRPCPMCLRVYVQNHLKRRISGVDHFNVIMTHLNVTLFTFFHAVSKNVCELPHHFVFYSIEMYTNPHIFSTFPHIYCSFPIFI
jgi:hypothetical protein